MTNKALNRFLSTRFFDLIIKSLLCLVFLSLLYFLIKDQRSLSDIYATFAASLDATKVYLLLLVSLMMCFNWWLEALKWQRLMTPIAVISLRNSFRSVLVGLATALFTPNRVGEYVGRVWLAPLGQRWKAAAALLLGSFIQMVLISLFGVAALIYLLNSGGVLPILDGVWQRSLISIAAIFALVAYYYAGTIISWVRRSISSRWILHWTRHLVFYKKFTARDLSVILVLTLLRLLIYTFQYFLLLRFFGIYIEWKSSIAAILACYFVQTSIPIPPFIALLARGEIALLIWDYYDVNELSILSASYSLWVINVLLPSLVGMIFVLKMNILKSLGYGSP